MGDYRAPLCPSVFRPMSENNIRFLAGGGSGLPFRKSLSRRVSHLNRGPQPGMISIACPHDYSVNGIL